MARLLLKPLHSLRLFTHTRFLFVCIHHPYEIQLDASLITYMTHKNGTSAKSLVRQFEYTIDIAELILTLLYAIWHRNCTWNFIRDFWSSETRSHFSSEFFSQHFFPLTLHCSIPWKYLFLRLDFLTAIYFASVQVFFWGIFTFIYPLAGIFCVICDFLGELHLLIGWKVFVCMSIHVKDIFWDWIMLDTRCHDSTTAKSFISITNRYDFNWAVKFFVNGILIE